MISRTDIEAMSDGQDAPITDARVLGLIREYRHTMHPNVLHSWAQDVVALLARPQDMAGDERVQRLVEAAREAEMDLSDWFECRGELIKAGFNMDGTEGIRDRLRAAIAALDTPAQGGGDE